MKNIAIFCEESQTACKAFRSLGFNAYSFDLQSCSGEHPEWHCMGDCTPYINGNCTFITQDGESHTIDGKWDLIIAHPPCTYLSNAGACRLYPHKGELNEERYAKGLAARAFFMMFYEADCEHICIENPIPSKIYDLPPKSQSIQPYEYGHPYTKKTYLWLKGLNPLKPTDVVYPIGCYVNGNAERWKRDAANGIVYGKEKSPKFRSKSFDGIAKAMAEQFGKEI